MELQLGPRYALDRFAFDMLDAGDVEGMNSLTMKPSICAGSRPS
jgi:hypothetical protein